MLIPVTYDSWPTSFVPDSRTTRRKYHTITHIYHMSRDVPEAATWLRLSLVQALPACVLDLLNRFGPAQFAKPSSSILITSITVLHQGQYSRNLK